MDRKDFLRWAGASALGMVAGIPIPGGNRGNEKGSKLSKNWAWITDTSGSPDAWKRRLEKLKKAGFDAVLPQDRFDVIIPAAQAMDMEVHAWLVSLQRGGDKTVQQDHPEWFMVNRNRNSSLTDPAYVDYYKWLCPSREPVHAFLKEAVRERLAYSELKGIHLDYIRYPDVILPSSLQPTYDIVQDKEYPQYDYCYCQVCRRRFEKQYGADPMALEDPAEVPEWDQYRYDQVTRLVNTIARQVHQANRELTAAVFPTPDIARTLVRQNWPDWDLDAVLPMTYQNFYEKDVQWIGQAVGEGRRELPRSTPLYSGLYLPSLSPDALARAYEKAMEAGAAGISIFTDTDMSEDHWEHIQEALQGHG